MPTRQSIAGLLQMGADYAPFAPGLESRRRTGFEGVPGFGPDSPFAMATPLLAPYLTQTMGQVGMVPFGLGHDQNVYDTMMRMRYAQAQIRAMQHAAEQDQSHYARSFRGIAALHGVPFGAEERRMANTLSRGVATMSPFLAEAMPDFLDQLGGTRGSGVVFTRRMMDAARYRIDPVTGQMGMSAESNDAVLRQVMQEMYLSGGSRRTQGFSLGQTGALFQELQSRGMLAGASGGMTDIRTQVQSALGASLAGAAPSGTGMLGGLAGLGGLSQQLNLLANDQAGGARQIDAARIRRSLEANLKAVSAVRDILGDAGMPNAPMAQLVQALEALSANSLSQVDPTRLANMVRHTHALSRQTGTTIDNAMMLQQHAANRGMGLGLEPIFAVQAAHGAMAFGGAYRGMGHAAHHAWGAMSADQLMQLDANLRQQGAASSLANQHNLVMRIRDTMGGFQAGTPLAAYADAVAAGVNNFTDPSGRSRSLFMNQNEFLQMFAGARRSDGGSLGLSSNAVLDMLSQQSTNREYGMQYMTGDLARRDQVRQVNSWIGQRLGHVLGTRLQGDPAAMASVGVAVANRITSEVGTEAFSSTAMRNDAVGRLIEQELQRNGQGGLLANMPEAERRRFLQGMSEQFYGHVNAALPGSMFSGFQSYQNFHRTSNASTLAETGRQTLQANLTTRMQEALAPLGRGSLLARAVDAIQGVDINDPNALYRVFSQSIGGVHGNLIGQAAMGEISGIRREQARVQSLQQELSRTNDPARRREIMAQLSSAESALATQARRLADVAQQYGYGDDGVSGSALGRAGETLRGIRELDRNLTGMRGYFGAEVSGEERGEISAAFAGGRRATRDEALAIVEARRREELRLLREGGPNANGQVSADTLGLFNAVQANLRRLQPGMNDAQTRAAALRVLEQQGVSPAIVEGLMRNGVTFSGGSVGEAEMNAVALLNRRNLPGAAPEWLVNRIMQENPGVTREEAQRRGDARLRAQRLGVRWNTLDDRMRRENVSEEEAIRRTLAERSEERWRGTPQEIATRERNIRSQFTAFWASEEGQAARENVQSMLSDMDSVAMAATTANGASRFGTQGLAMSRDVRHGQGRLFELARQYAGGDMGRLLMGDLNPGLGRETSQRVLAEKDQILESFESVRERLAGTAGVPGRSWVNPTQEAAARRRLGLAADNLTGPQQLLLRSAMRDLGSESSARRLLGIAQDAPLSDWQRARIAAVRFGAGNDQQIAAMVGEGRWALMGEGERAALRNQMRGGGLTEAQAITALGLDASNLTDEGRQMIAALGHGLASDAHARQLLGLGGILDPTQTQMVGARYGLASSRYARMVHGLAADPLTEEQRQRLDAELGREADRDTARQLLGIRGAVPAAQQAAYDQLVGNLGNARRLSPSQEQFVLANRNNAAALAPLAGALNLSPADLITAAETGRRVQTYVTDQAAAANRPGADVARDIFRGFGFGSPDAAMAQELGGVLDSTRGRLFGASVLRHQSYLQGRAAAGGGQGLSGVDSMLREYRELQGSGDWEDWQTRMAGFRSRYGISDLDEFRNALQFQESAGLLDVGLGSGRRRQSMGDLAGVLRQGSAEPGSPAAAAQAQPTQITGRLQVDLFGGFGDLVATLNSTLNHVTPSGN